ncbi:MAG: glycerophosphodiester phosphodiesterase, partial [Bacteroidales bacterium]|nr:glycerophosphodiester phosphodiesterase [Bacteroidales bacterium]
MHSDPEPERLVVAHRGAYAEFSLPGNSLAALRKACELGCYASECDINLSSDGKVVVLHDGSWAGLLVKDHTYAELCAAGRLSNGESIPLLEDFIYELIETGSKTRLWIDCKSLSDEEGGNAQSIAAAEAAAEIIRLYRAENRVAFIVGRIAVWRAAQAAADGDWPVAYMNYDLTPAKFLSQVAASGHPWANLNLDGFGCDDAKLKSWEDAGIKVSFYNVNSVDQRAWWLRHSSRIIACTDYPRTLLDQL